VREDDEVAPGSGTTREERRRDSSRVLALTDGVFAIIITLLVLEIHVPELTSHESLRAAISDVRPSFISFVLAFIVAAMQWAGDRLARQGLDRRVAARPGTAVAAWHGAARQPRQRTSWRSWASAGTGKARQGSFGLARFVVAEWQS